MIFILFLMIYSGYQNPSFDKSQIVIIFLCLCFYIMGICFTNIIQKEYEKYDEEKNISMNGKVVDILETEYERIIVLEKGTLLFYIYNTDDDNLNNVNIGNSIRVEGKIKAMNVARNPGNYNEKDYLHSIKVAGKIDVNKVLITSHNIDEISVYTKKIQSIMCEQIEKIAAGDDAGTLKAMLFGYRNDLEKEVKERYKTAGILHLISLSGLHIGVIGEIIFKLFRKKFQYYTSTFVSGIIMLLFALIVGESISTIRAVIMFSISLFARLMGLRYDLKSSLSLAMLLMLIYNPFYLYNTSFRLSVLAIVAIAYVYSEIEKILKRHCFNRILGAFFASLSITIVTIPIISSTYFEISTYSVFANILVIPLMTVILFMGMLAVFTSFFSVMIGAFFIGIDVFVLGIYDYICNFVNHLPKNIISIAKMSKEDMIMYYLILGFIVIILKLVNCKKIHINRILYSISISVLVVFLCIIVLKKNNTEITFLDVGQGDCTFINIDNTTILIDGGSSDIKSVGKNRIVPLIKSYGYDYIDAIIVSHTDDDHISGIVEIIEEKLLRIGCVYVPCVETKSMDDFIEILKINNVEYKGMKEGNYIKINEGYFRALNPAKNLCEDKDSKKSNINDNSLVILFEINNIKAMFTGDISSKIEILILKKYSDILKNVEILKVAHHGSKTASCNEFISVLKPVYSIISCGINNSYNHPHKKCIDELESIESNIYITKDSGAIFINFGGENLLTDTYL